MPQTKGPQRPVQRTRLSAIPRPAAPDRCGGSAGPRRRPSRALPADPGRGERARVGGHGDALRRDDARIARGARRGDSARSRSARRSSRPTPTCSNIIRRTATATWCPEQRVLRIARIGPEQVAGRDGHRPGNRGLITTRTRPIMRPRRRATSARRWSRTRRPPMRSRRAAKGGATTRGAAAGANAAVTSLSDQTRDAYACGRRRQDAAAAVFAAPSGEVVGPVQIDFGWAVAKVDSVKTIGGKTLDQARAEIASKITADKRKGAIEDIWSTRSRTRSTTAAISPRPRAGEAAGHDHAAHHRERHVARRSQRSSCRPSSPRRSRPGSRLEANDPPEIVSLPNDQGYAMVSPGQVVAAAPAPLANVRDQVAEGLDRQPRRWSAPTRRRANRIEGRTRDAACARR